MNHEYRDKTKEKEEDFYEGDDPGLSFYDEEEKEEESYVAELRRIWLTEKCSPVITKYEENIVEKVKTAIELREQVIIEEKEQNKEDFWGNLLQMEVDRVKYLLTSYLRARVRKIEKYCMHVLMEPGVIEKLSPFEIEFAKQYVDLLENHLNTSFLNHIPDKFRSLTQMGREEQMVDVPNKDHYVFCRVKKNESIEIGGQTYKLRKHDSILVTKYKLLEHEILDANASLIREKKVELI